MTNIEIDELKVLQEYRETMANGLRHSFPLLSKEELYEAIDNSIFSRLTNSKATIDNNYTKNTVNTTVIDVIKYIERLEPIVTSSGVLFRKHKDADNPLSRMIKGFLDSRAKYKAEMFKYPKGSEMFQRFNLSQILEKLNANGTYGVLGSSTSMFYNIYVAEAITRQGRSYISCSIMLFESLLANNVKFNSVNEVVAFIYNTINEKPNRTHKDYDVLDRNITVEECFYKLMNTADMAIWIPSYDEMCRVWEYVNGLDQEDINRLYYKNNLYSFIELPNVMSIIYKIFNILDVPFMDPNKPPKKIVSLLEELLSLVKEYVYYPHFYIDKLDRVEYMQRDIVAICDTDSTIISFDAWYRFILDKVYDKDIPIKRQKRDMLDVIKTDEWGDRELRNMCEIIDPEYDYNFYTDEVIEIHKLIDPCSIIPQDMLKYAIINIIGYICGKLVIDYLNEYSKLTGSYVEGVKCRMIMKNEFYFLRALLTQNRRNYSDIQMTQEGNIIPEDNRLAIMGMPINKSTLSKDVKDRLQKILLEDILTSDNIDQLAVMKKLIILEKDIYNSIMNKETKYYKPDNIAPMSSYKSPSSVNGIIAALVYNHMRDESMPYINLEERNKIIKIKLYVTKKNVDKIKDLYPVEYGKLLTLLKEYGEVKIIALPLDVKVPEWILSFVDTDNIINSQLKNFPLDSIGVSRLNNDAVNVSNIISL